MRLHERDDRGGLARRVVCASMIRTSTVPKRGCGPHVPPQERRLGDRRRSGSAGRPPRRSRRSRRTRAGCPTRGNAWNSGVRADARPVSRPCQNGELTDSASSSGRCARIRLYEPDRVLGVGHADVHVQRERRLAPRQLAHRAVDELVALAARHDRVVPDRERVRARAGARAGPSARAPRPARGAASRRSSLDRRRPSSCAPAAISSAEPCVSPGHVPRELVAAATAARGRPCCASAQSPGLSSITSSSAPTRVRVRAALPFGPAVACSCRRRRVMSRGSAQLGRRRCRSGRRRRRTRGTARAARAARRSPRRATVRRPRSRGRAARCPRSRRRAPRRPACTPRPSSCDRLVVVRVDVAPSIAAERAAEQRLRRSIVDVVRAVLPLPGRRWAISSPGSSGRCW